MLRAGLSSLLAASILVFAQVQPSVQVDPPLTKAGNRLGIRPSTTAVSGSMSATQASDLAFVLSGGAGVTDPLTVPHWSSSTGFDNLTTTALVDSNMEFMGQSALGIGQIQGLGGEAPLASDSGTRANTSDITGTTTMTGALTWAVPSECTNGAGVASNKFSNVLANRDCSVVDTGTADGYVQITLPVGAGENNTGILFRWNTVADGFQLLFFSDGNYYVNRYTAGIPFTVSTGACATAPDAGLQLRADYLGTTIRISCNGVQKGSFTDTNFTSNTRVGFGWLGSGSETFTNFSAGTGSTQSLLFSPLNSTTIFEESFQTWKVDHDQTVAGASAQHATTVTTLGASGQITSTVAGGTAPLVVASTTKVTNWNADLLDGLDSTAFALAGIPSYFTMVSTRNVTATSANSSPITLSAAMTPIACTAEVQSVGVGAGTCTYALFDSTASSALCTVSLACNSSSGATGTCASSGSAASGHVLVLQETAPAANTSSAFVVLTCSH